MCDPKNLDISNWALEVLSGLLVAAGVGGATMATKTKAKIDGRLNDLEQGHSDQVTQLAELKLCQENTREHLGHIREATQGTNDRLDLLMAAMANRMPEGKRRTYE